MAERMDDWRAEWMVVKLGMRKVALLEKKKVERMVEMKEMS